MTYRGVVRHVRYWRGQIHKWSTVYQFVGTASAALTSSDAQLLLNADNKMLFSTGANLGGTYACALYNQAEGGVPVAVYTAFDWTAPGSWLAGAASVWTTSGLSLESAAEVALSVRWPAGLSKSGKPVTIRKWYHMVPAVSTTGPTQQVAAANVTALQTQAQAINGVLGGKGLTLGAASGRIAGTGVTVDPFYNNHQMPRGRRRKVTSQSRAAADYQKVLQVIEGNAYSGT